MILVINVCKERLHELEFVKPIQDILKKNKIKFITKHYKKLNKQDLNASKIIICGTSLKDNYFLKDLFYFNFLKNYKKPVLGICAGMEILGLVFGGKLKKKKQIGLIRVDFKKPFLGFKGKKDVYHLHSYSVESPYFEQFIPGFPQAMKYKKSPFYGVLFHPEVRQKELIVNFCRKVYK